VGFETTIPALERAKRVHALERSATVIGVVKYYERERVSAHFDTEIKLFLYDLPYIISFGKSQD
jgi:hypothetical protein